MTGLLAGLLFVASLAAATIVSASEPVTVGFKDFTYSGGGASRATADKPQSKLWYAGGKWWAGLFVRTSAPNPNVTAYRIHRLVGDSWVDTTINLDIRDESHADYYFDSATNKLYVLSAGQTHPTCTPADPLSDDLRLYRYSFASAGAGSYTADVGFPVVVDTCGAYTATIAKDSGGTLWAAYPQGVNVMVAHSTAGDAVWGAPYRLPVQDVAKNLNPGSPGVDADTTAVVAFGPNKIGVAWTNHSAAPATISFAVHNDGGADDAAAWGTTAEPALGAFADDHLNVKTDPDGNVWIVTKTGLDGDADKTKPLIQLLQRSAGGAWTTRLVSTVADLNTRPQLLISDTTPRVAYVLMTAPNGGGSIYYKSAPINSAVASENFKFATGTAAISMPGVPFIRSAVETNIDDVTTTKQNITAATGLLAEASDLTRFAYFHNVLPITATDPVGNPPTGTVSINTAAAATNTSAVSVAVPATDAGSGVSQVRLSNSLTAGELTTPTTFAYTTPVAWSLAAGADGVRTVYAQWRDGAGNWSTVQSDTIILDASLPTGTLAIAGGAPTINSTAVTLNLTASDGSGSGVTQVKISNGDPTAAVPQVYADSIAWTLAAGDGLKTVSIQLIDAAGNASTTISDGITLDTTPPAVGTVTIGGGPVVSVNVTLTLGGAGGDATAARVSNSPTMSAPAAIPLTGGPWTLDGGSDGPRTVYAQWADALGNWSAPVASNTVTLDAHVPLAPTVTAIANASLVAKVSITPSALDGDVNRVYIEAKSGSCLATPGPSTPAIPYVAGTPVSFPLGGGAPWSLCVWVQDLASFSPPTAVDVVVDVTRPRVGGAPLPRFIATTVGSLPVRLGWTAGSDTGSGIANYLVRRQIGTGAWVTIGTTSARTFDVNLLTGRLYRFGIAPVDRAGNVGPFVYGARFRTAAFQERAASIRYGRGWALSNSPSYWGGHAKYTRTRLASTTFTFTGRNVAWVAPRNSGQGRARVYIDGRLVATVNLYSATSLSRQIVYTRAWTTSRRHTVRIVGLGTTGHPRVTVDAFLTLR